MVNTSMNNNDAYYLQKYIEELELRLSEFEAVKKIIKEFENNNTNFLVPLISGVFVKARVVDKNNFVVNIGNNVFVNKDISDIKSIVVNEINNLKSTLNNLYSELSYYQKD